MNLQEMVQMQEIGQILSNQDSFPVPDSGTNRNNVLTTAEAEELGLRFRTQPPEPKTCQYCGKVLYHEGIRFADVVSFWSPSPKRCSCPEAQAYWSAYDSEQQRIQEQEEIARRRAATQEKIDQLIGRSGLKKRFKNRTFQTFKAETPKQKKAYAVAKEYADRFFEFYQRGEGLYIEGTNGTGKTHLAAAITLQLINEGIPVVCKTSIELLDNIKQAFDGSQVSEYDILKVYKQVDLLIIDDLGKEQCTDWSMSILYSILNDRYEDLRPTIITTNFNEETLIRNLTPRGFDSSKVIAIISRLREVSTVITMAWEDFRSCGYE
ncbi:MULTISPECIES: ATP-binding protein [unclassified Dehalobacter]|uniref:ATP-binding protein n=1 Tax=unclassified Dehalobacter TaxID=2635733 RepID=UPI0014050C75|nr:MULTISPECIES: ATP-binding protein [unclassified Dehalobacter]